MGIIVNETYVDDRGFTSPLGTYASFSRGFTVSKVTRSFNVEITQEDASGNPNSNSTIVALTDASGNKMYDASNNLLTRTIYNETRTKEVYFVRAPFVHYKDKQSRLDKNKAIGWFDVRLDVELTDFANIFSKLYEKVKTDKTLFPYTNLTDDL
tara:strand:- start:3474 stop:3935 length:462 start_codon:yes stop_codon:yes gene_type:complete